MTRPLFRPASAAKTATIPFAPAATGWLAAFVLGSMLVAPALTAAIGGVGDASIPALVVGLLGMWAVFIGALFLLSRNYGTGDFVRDYAVSARWRDLVMVPLGVALQFAVSIAYWPLRQIWPNTFSDEALSKTARDLADRAHGANMVLLGLAVVVGAPVVEELVYRGLLQRSLSRRWQPVAAWVAVSAWFGFIHFRPVEFVGLFLAGLLFGAGYLLTGRVGPAMFAHIAFNATGLVMAYRSLPGGR